jgi:hypothetical protein
VVVVCEVDAGEDEVGVVLEVGVNLVYLLVYCVVLPFVVALGLRTILLNLVDDGFELPLVDQSTEVLGYLLIVEVVGCLLYYGSRYNPHLL